MTKTIRLILIEDNEDDAVLIERVIKKSGYAPDIHRVCTAEELSKALEQETWDAVLCDYMMPEFNIADALSVISAAGLDLPFIIVSGAISDETAVEMMKAGAHDYLTKNNLSRLVPALDREIKEAEQRHRRQEAEEQLKESEKKHRMLVESITDTVLVIDPNNVITEFYSQTPISEKLSIPEHIGKEIHSIYPEAISERIVQLVSATIEKNQTSSFEYPLYGRWHSARISRHEDGRRIVMVSRDITELKEAEEATRQSHAIAMLYQDITGHDIRNLLQAIIIASDLLYEDEVDPSKKDLICHVADAVTEASEIITSAQATAELLTTPLERTSLDFTVRSCSDLFQEEHSELSIISDIGVTNAVVDADRYLCHMVMSLLSNAVKHNNSSKKQVWTRLSEESDGYELSISDNGPGIKDSMKKSLLNPERRSGGVGILQCMQIASKYGGTFEILNRIDGDWTQGAKVRVWLPRAKA